MTNSDFQKLALEREIKISAWVEKNRNLLLATALFCIASIGAIGGLTVGRWWGAAEENARSASELWRMKDSLDYAISGLKESATKVDTAAAKVAETAEQIDDANEKIAVKVDAVAAAAGAASAKASTAAAHAQKAAAAATTPSLDKPAPAVSVNRAVRDANSSIQRNQK